MNRNDLKIASCSSEDVDGNLFFPEFDDNPETYKAKVEKAKEICSTCPVRMKCLQSALDNKEDYGVWGGRDETDLRRARFTDVSGKPIKYRPSIICPNCLDETKKDLYVIETFANSSDVGCHACGLMWEIRKVLDRDFPNWG